MRLRQLVYPLLFAVALLSAQVGGAMHAVGHTLAERSQSHDQPPPHNHACEQCEAYTQLGSALHSGSISFALHDARDQLLVRQRCGPLASQPLAAPARGPPALPMTA